MDPLIAHRIENGRHPFELLVLGFGLVVGAPLLVGAPTPGSTEALLGPVMVRVWAWLLVGGCWVALTGAWWTWWRQLDRWVPAAARLRHDTGLLVEMVGLVAVGAGTVIYGIGVWDGLDTPGRQLPAAIIAGFGVACWVRASQIWRFVRSTLRAMREVGR
ncbi:hypothetical protein [Klenkia brasiliensis]|uniref:Uncharacterized protein n=1 Tax=Klenkia brasiliensis TaxID=333142 RepID=A0A1G7YEF8_9ACTN|nr:hypothetical protein [Klenkia brasiliensis]SDG94763.1 hypothetical protein SAMN05660324_3926 [Klenkia brasiliensis]